MMIVLFLLAFPRVLAALDMVKFQSSNYPHHWIRHSGYDLFINQDDGSDLFDKDSSFKKVEALDTSAGAGYFSFESVNYPGYYIRHSGFRLKIANYENTDLFKKDASWKEHVSLDGKDYYNSYESRNYPNRYIRHRSYEVWLDEKPSNPSQLFLEDASFKTGNSFFNPRGYWQRVGGFGGGGSLIVTTTIGVSNHEESELTETFGVSVTATVSSGMEFAGSSTSVELSTTVSSEIAERSLSSVTRTAEVSREFTCEAGDAAMYQWVTTLTESGFDADFDFDIRSNDIWCVSDDSLIPRCPFGYCADHDCQNCDEYQNVSPLPQHYSDYSYVLYLVAFLVVLLTVVNVMMMCYRNCCGVKNGRARYQMVKIVDSDVDASDAQAINI